MPNLGRGLRLALTYNPMTLLYSTSVISREPSRGASLFQISFRPWIMPTMEHRSQGRYRMNETALLSLPGMHPSPATLLNISASGCLLESDLDIAPGTEILATLSSMFLICTTRHSRPSSRGTFLIGAVVIRNWPKDKCDDSRKNFQ